VEFTTALCGMLLYFPFVRTCEEEESHDARDHIEQELKNQYLHNRNKNKIKSTASTKSVSVQLEAHAQGVVLGTIWFPCTRIILYDPARIDRDVHSSSCWSLVPVLGTRSPCCTGVSGLWHFSRLWVFLDGEFRPLTSGFFYWLHIA